ncbi:MAG: response regulator [Zhengella sp.]|uniref:PAS domain-containing hybrid sensor histidine kinase/response regulator n=1 Tax=Zhengella sp. TaxID=2282762 RepID=UPI0035298CA2|nr:response regulator [Brucellaceae bacterium]
MDTRRQPETAAMEPAGHTPAAGRGGLLRQRLLPEETGAGKLVTGCGLMILMLAGLAGLGGTSGLVTTILAVFGIAGAAAGIALDRRERKQLNAIASTAEAQDADYEALADRMWELQESEERFLGLIDALGDLVVHRDRKGRIVYANGAFARLLELDPRNIRGLTLADLGITLDIAPDTGHGEGDCLTSSDVSVQTAAGIRWFSWTEHSIRDGRTGTVSHRAIARDITARKKAEHDLIEARERAEAASQAKSRFLATVSHEIRTPMNGIVGMARLLADTGLTPEQKTYVDSVSTSADALLLLIEDLLDFSKIEAGRIEIVPQDVLVREIVDSVVELLASRAYAKGIAIAAHVDPRVPETLVTDPGKLRQVLLNLAGNAVKFTETGGVRLSVTMAAGACGPAVSIAIGDTGPGLKPEDRERIFEDFEQADGTSTRRHGGAGLGLAISRRLINAMGGAIGVESEPGKGSVFTVSLPCAASPALPARHLAGRRYLLLLSSRLEAEVLAATLSAEGAKAIIHDGVEAAMETGPDHFDAMLIDAELEQGDALERLRAAGISASNPVILIAPGDRGRLAGLRSSGYLNFLARPVRGTTLLRILVSDTHAARPALPARDAPSRAKGPGLSILLAEDNPINAMLARAALERAGHNVTLAEDGGQAVDLFARQAGTGYDVILMDLHMPVLDGLDAIDRIRAMEEEHGWHATPVLVLTADGQEETRARALAHGANGFLTKPLDPDRLSSAVLDAAA